LASAAAFGQQQVNLTAGPANVTLPDGSAVPMWGYSCGAAVAGSSATCAKLNPTAPGWSPVVITVPTTAVGGLGINLTNSLTFGANSVPTSIVIVGQLGGGLGIVGQRTTTAAPDHSNAQTVTWPIACPPGSPAGTQGCSPPVGTAGPAAGTPPTQGPRVQSFSTEVLAGATTALTWSNLRPGTYLIESGTHPSIQGPMGLYGILVVTTVPTTTPAAAPGTAYPGVTYSAELPLLLSEIDPVQNNAVSAAVNTSNFSETAVWSGLPGGCGNPASATYHTCYPPAVNYTPLYYLFNGVAFDKTNAANSLFPTSPAGTTAALTTGNVLVRFVNAGLRMHVPSIVGAVTGAGVSGFSLVAEDGNPVPGVARVQSEVFLAPGKTYDVMVSAPATVGSALPVYDRELSLSANAISRDAGMLAYISVNGAGLPGAAAAANNAPVARTDTYNSIITGQTLTVSDPAKGLIANDSNIYGVHVVGTAPTGLVLNADGTFTYSGAPTTFTYCGNGATSGAACATVNLNAAVLESAGGITCAVPAPVAPATSTYAATAASFSIKPPGILAFCKDAAGYPLTVNAASVPATCGSGVLSVDPKGGFNVTGAPGSSCSFSFKAQNSQNTVSSTAATVSVAFPTASNLAVTVYDGTDKTTVITDYRWIIEEDRTFFVDPNCTTNPPPTGCPGSTTTGPLAGIVPTFGTNFHTSYMPVVAAGCTGATSCETGQTLLGVGAVCDVGNGVCRTSATQQAPLLPSAVHLDPTKRYYISILPGDAANPFIDVNLTANCTNGQAKKTGSLRCGHGMGGASIPAACPPGTASCTAALAPVTIWTQPAPFPPAKLSVFVFEDDFPLNGEQDAGGGIDVLASNEPGLGHFNITLFDDAGGTGDATGQMTYDMFNQPLANSLAGTLDPATGNDACPISTNSRQGMVPDPKNPANMIPDVTQTGITGTIVTCPKFEAQPNGGAVTNILSPLAGQAVVANLMPGRYGVVATPGADRIASGEEWLQTNTLDGQKAHDSFLRIGEPSFFQEFGPAGYHVSIGFASPQIINSRLKGVCNGTDVNVTGANCTNSVTGRITTERMSRSPDERLYGSGSNDSFSFTQCYVSLGDTDGEDFAFTKCAPDGSFTLSGIPQGTWRVTVFDQWNDMLVDGLSTPVGIANGGGQSVNMGDIAMNQWQANIYTTTFFDANNNGVRDPNEAGLTLAPTNIRFRDGSYSNFNNTDLAGNAGFNEEFPLFSWYVIESDQTRYKNTGTHVVYDSGGPADGTPNGGTSNIAQFYANTIEQISVPAELRVPGAVYCSNADCTGFSIANGPGSSAGSNCTSGAGGGAATCAATPTLTTGRIDPPWVLSEAWQGFSGQNSFLEFGKKPYAAGENGGIRGEVIYASTRPFDDPQLLIHTSWTPDVPGVTINLYQVGSAPDGSQSLTLVDTTKTTSWDDWAQGFRSDGNPNMNCPGQGQANSGPTQDLFFFTLFNQPTYLDLYSNQHNGTALHPVPDNSQFKCYDGMHNWNQLQPAPYDGMYTFPSVVGRNPTTGNSTGTNCTICVKNNDPTDPFRFGKEDMLPRGQYVVEVVVPPGYELVKEEDKNILIGDNYIAPVTVQFPGLGSAIYILPDQAEVSAAYNANNAQNPTNGYGRYLNLSSHEGDTGSVETFWPCVGASRVVPDYISLFPQSHEVAPFAGATRNLCDRKLVTLDDQTSALAKFWIFSSTHVAAHFTGVITDDFTSEFDPFSPQFGEKFSPPNMPVALKDWTGTEISRVYADQWGTYNGLTYSTWEVNPPNPTGYAPTMMVTCMNDPGTGTTPDPLYNPQYSQFCYEIPFMPGQTQYMDTPVVPTSAFAGAGYNNPDCAYPDTTPAIKEVDGDGVGPYIAAGGAGHPITIHSLGKVVVPNNAYSGPSATTAPYNQKTVTRNYGFGATQGTGSVTIGGVAATVTGWSDATITVTVPATGPNQVPTCPLQQQAQYGGSTARCGELVITAGNGKQSIDTVTVTVGGKAPTRIVAPAATASTGSPFGPIQNAINAAAPGDLLIVQPGVYNEILLMWKPVRLQGVGAASSIINANSQPAGRMDTWRSAVNCLFGLALNGQPYSTPGHLVPLPGGGGSEPLNPYDATGVQSCPASGWNYFGGGPNNPQVDRIPLEGILGWDTTLNGNLAELLQEPSLMGAYEGAGITVLAKGVRYPAGLEVFGAASDTEANANVAHEGQMPAFVAANGNIHGTVMLTNSNTDCNTSGPINQRTGTGYTSNFMCNPSRIDGLSITNSSQGGGGIYVHGWAHFLEIANNRVTNNTGTLTGGITVGQGESPDALLAGNEGDPVGFDQQPWTCNDLVPGAEIPGAGANAVNQNVSPTGIPTNTQLPYCYNEKVNVHHNSVTSNSSIGDELFSSTPAGAGGVTFCVGADYYKFNFNWVCGNLSTGDGGGLAHLGFIWHGDIEHNTFLFNQSTNPTVPTNGGGIIVMGAAPDGTLPGAAPGTECGSTTDVDCAPGLSDGTGPGTTINANLIMGNSADSGSGGGIRLQDVNGTDVGFFPRGPLPVTTGPAFLRSPGWNSVSITNNIIANNVAGWDGAGVSLQDALVANLINNTIISNDTTASSGVLFNTIGAPLASAPGSNCIQPASGGTASCPQPAGVVTMQNTSLLTTSLNGVNVSCPAGHGTGQTCKNFSIPLLANDVIWDNRSFYIGITGPGSGLLSQQNLVALYNAFAATPVVTQPTGDATASNGTGMIITGGTGACVSGVSYWDVGVRGDTGPTNHAGGVTLAPTYSVLTSLGGAADYAAASLHNTASNPTVLSQYCNGSRTPPEFQSLGYQVPPGIADATVPNPVFNLTPAATVDEGNNWINLSWGPLAETNAVSGALLGNYGPASSSSVINYIPASASTYAEAPSLDFYGTERKTNNAVDAGAVEFTGTAAARVTATVSPNPLAFGSLPTGTTSSALNLTVTNTGTAALAGGTFTFGADTPQPFSRVTTGTFPAGAPNCGGGLAVGASCTIKVVFTPPTATAFSSTLTVAYTGATVTPASVTLTGAGTAPATVSISPLTITLPTGSSTGTGTVTLTNTAPAGGASVQVNNVAVSGGGMLSYVFTNGPLAGPDTCTGATVAPGGTCSVSVRFTNLRSARGVNRAGTITFTDTGAGSPQSGPLTGFATLP
jgi:hypothetical protein